MFKLVEGVLLRVYFQGALGASVGNVYDCAFVGHQRGQRFDFLLIDKGGIADSAFCRQGVLAVGCPPSGKNFVSSL